MTSVVKFMRALLFVIAAAVGLAGAIAGILAEPSKVPIIGPALGDYQRLSSFLLGFLITLIAVEMLTIGLQTNAAGQRTLDGVQRLRELLENQSPVILEGEKTIYEYASDEVAKAQRLVRAVTFREKHREDEPDYWSALSDRMKTRNAQGKPIEYRHIYGYSDVDNVRKAELYHREYFSERGLASYWKPRFIPTSSGVDMLIVDDSCVIIALPVLPSDDSLRRAVVLPTVDGLVTDVVSWFDNYLSRRAEDTV